MKKNFIFLIVFVLFFNMYCCLSYAQGDNTDKDPPYKRSRRAGLMQQFELLLSELAIAEGQLYKTP